MSDTSATKPAAPVTATSEPAKVEAAAKSVADSVAGDLDAVATKFDLAPWFIFAFGVLVGAAAVHFL